MNTTQSIRTLLAGTLLAAAIAGVLWLGVTAAPPPTGAQTPPAGAIDPADFQAQITNPLFPISLTGPRVYQGRETDPETGETIESRLESRVLDQTEVVMGVTVAVLEEKAYEDGELIELALDYVAQHKDGDVYYFGERVDNYEDGALKDHAGQWLAGVDGAQPGVLVPAHPQVGQTVQQELAPGIAEDRSTVLALDERVTVPAGTYTGCMKDEGHHAFGAGHRGVQVVLPRRRPRPRRGRHRRQRAGQHHNGGGTRLSGGERGRTHGSGAARAPGDGSGHGDRWRQ